MSFSFPLPLAVHSAYEDDKTNYLSYGVSLVEFDKQAERRLRTKIDWMIIPIVSILYLFCFIDRANIGMRLAT